MPKPRKRRRRQYNSPQKNIQTHQKSQQTTAKANQKTLFGALRRVAEVALGAATIGGIFLAYTSVFPSISIAPGALRDSKDPFSSHFILTNDGSFGIHDVRYDCEFTSLMSGPTALKKLIEWKIDLYKRISPKATMSLYCGGYYGQSPDGSQLYSTLIREPVSSSITHGFVTIYITYRPSFFLPTRVDAFSFAISRDVDGNVIWLSTNIQAQQIRKQVDKNIKWIVH